MGQNTSSAVMQQRSEPHQSLDDFPTPPWATRALCEWLNKRHNLEKSSCREPAANRGHMANPLGEYFNSVDAFDVHDYGAGYPTRDFLFPENLPSVYWTITNPPFRLAEDFINRAHETSRVGLAVLVRSAFLEGIGRYQRLFSHSSPSSVLQFSERVVMHKGKLSQYGSTATAYCWLVWAHQLAGKPTQLVWIPPSRKQLERDSDYPSVGEAA